MQGIRQKKKKRKINSKRDENKEEINEKEKYKDGVERKSDERKR